MKLFVYKTLIVIFFAFVLFEFTIGKEIKKLENAIKIINSERGREIIADKIRVTTIACLRYMRINSGVSNPILVKKYTKIGNSKMMPFAKHTVVTVEI